MNRADSATQADDLPGFLDEGSAPTKDETTTTASEGLDAGDGDESFPGTDTAAEESQAEPAPATRAKQRGATTRTAGGGGPLTAAGCALMLGAVALGLAGDAAGSVLTNLARFGLSPASMVLAGIVLVGIASMRGRIHTLQRRLDETSGSGTDLQATLQSLLASQASAEGSAASGGEGQQQLLVTLQRQDEKIGNLTKALKMYGKPIMEIAAQSTELAAGMTQAKTAADATLEASKQSWARIETALRSGAGTKETFDGLREEVRKVAAAVEAVAKRPGQTVSFEPLQQQMTRTEVAVQAVSQRLEDTEVRKSLMRLEDAAGKARDAVQQLLKGESIEKAATNLRERLDQATAKLHDGLEKIRDGSLGGLETSVREIQREIASVATRCSQIQAMVKSGSGSSGPSSRAGQPATVAAPAAVAAQVASSGSPPSPETATTTSPAATGSAATTAAGPAPAANAPAGGYQTGTRTTNSKNVLGAIAKLKQMKG